MPYRQATPCSTTGCPGLATTGSKCGDCRAEAEQRRGNFRQRGYRRGHDKRFRPGVLRRDPVCVLCHRQPATVADHWPRSRRELEAAGLDPDDPAYGRGLCTSCDPKQTAQRQPGGWHAERA